MFPLFCVLYIINNLGYVVTCSNNNYYVDGNPNAPTSYFTPPPYEGLNAFDCKWTTASGESIDLSSLYGSILTYSSTLSPSYNYFYTPCNDGVICTQNDTNLDTMAIQDKNGFCISYLAKFNTFIEPIYSELTQTFTFEYSNGEISGICDNPRELVVEWICSPNNEYKVKSVSEIAACIYKISIDSYLACVNETKVTSTTTSLPVDCEFGMYNYDDSEAIEDDGWKIMTLNDFNNHTHKFVEYYNTNEGLKCIKSWECGNCCFRVDEGEYLTLVNGNMDNYECDVLPAIAPDSYECCPTDGYFQDQIYIFYRKNYGQYLTSITETNLTFGEVERCSDINNPAVYQRNCW